MKLSERIQDIHTHTKLPISNDTFRIILDEIAEDVAKLESLVRNEARRRLRLETENEAAHYQIKRAIAQLEAPETYTQYINAADAVLTQLEAYLEGE